MSTFRDGHQAGRFDATERQHKSVATQIAERCSVCLVTEYRGLKFPIPGWSRTGSEVAIVYDRERWYQMDAGVVRIPTNQWHRGTSPRDTVNVEWAMLRHRTRGIRLLRGGSHLPAGHGDPTQSLANFKALNSLARFFKPIMGIHKPDVTTLSFDMNRQLTSAKQRDFVETSVEALDMHLHVPPGSTRKPGHTIDGATSTHPARLEMMNWRAGYDHRGFTIHSEV